MPVLQAAATAPFASRISAIGSENAFKIGPFIKEVEAQGKRELTGSANAMFRGDPAHHDPEDFFLTAISSCHMLSYLALCARRGINVIAYEDDARGTLVLDGDGGRFSEVTLRPRVTISSGDVERARELHHRAHEECFIANSCSVPIRCEPTIVQG